MKKLFLIILTFTSYLSAYRTTHHSFYTSNGDYITGTSTTYEPSRSSGIIILPAQDNGWAAAGRALGNAIGQCIGYGIGNSIRKERKRQSRLERKERAILKAQSHKK